jgi:hypothetical protein
MVWTSNTIMSWTDNRGTPTLRKITDHNRSALSVAFDRIEKKQRMADGTLRRYVVAIKRSWSCSWKDLPSKAGVTGYLTTADGGWAASDMEAFHKSPEGSKEFLMQLRDGDGTLESVSVMITDFSKVISKRSAGIDLWDISITLEEV